MISKKIVFIAIALFLCSNAKAAEGNSAGILLTSNAIRNISGSDLVCSGNTCASSWCGTIQGHILTPTQVQCLIDRKVIHDSSELNPQGDSILWSPNFEKSPYKVLWTQIFQFPSAEGSREEAGVSQNGETFNYADTKGSVIGRINLSAVKQSPTSQGPDLFSIQLGPKTHNILLRRALLRKLGYFVPPLQNLKTFKIKFTGTEYTADQMLFLGSIKSFTFMDPKKWILNLEDICIGNDKKEVVTLTYNTSTHKYEPTGKVCSTDDIKKNPISTFTRVVNKSDTLEMQDATIFKGADDSIYNFARGNMTQTRIAGRRLFNSLIIPYVLTDIGPDINFADWNGASVFNDNLILPYEYGNEFTTTLDDAKWLMRRLLTLKRSDFEDVVAAADLPKEDALLLVEKLISRRNYYGKILLPSEYTAIPFNQKISSGSILQGGLLKSCPWTDYAIEFCDQTLDNPKNPLSLQEILSFIEAKGIGNAIENLVQKFNLKYIKGTNLPLDFFNHQLDLSAAQFAKFLETGKVSKIPFGIWHDKFWNGNIIASRDVVIGSYLGSDSPIQLADTIGFQIGGGFIHKADGLKASDQLSSQEKLYTTWTYTHLKPLSTIKKAVTDPITNILVPLLKLQGEFSLEDILPNELSKTYDLKAELGKIKNDCDNTTRKYHSPMEDHISEALAKFKQILGPGESLIIQKNLGAMISENYTHNLSIAFQAQETLYDNFRTIDRIHIFRKDNDTIQIFRTPTGIKALLAGSTDENRAFKTPSTANTFGGSIGLSTYSYPIITIAAAKNNASINTNFYTLNLAADLCKNPSLLDYSSSLLHTLKTNDTTPMDVIPTEAQPTLDYQPYRMHHRLSESEFNPSFFVWSFSGQKLFDEIKLKYPGGYQKNLVLRTTGYRRGRDIQDTSIQITNALIKEYGNPNIQISAQGNGNPADTIFGKAFTKRSTFQAISNAQSNPNVEEPYSSVEYQWRGWSIKRDPLLKIIHNQEAKWKTTLFTPEKLGYLTDVKLYNLLASISVYADGLEYMASVPAETVRSIFDQYGDTDTAEQLSDIFVSNQKDYLSKRKNDANKASKYALNLITNAENNLTIEGFQALVGGKQNMLMQASLDGYKVGDPNGLATLMADTSGALGSPKPDGPLNFIMRALNINPSEFYIYWLLNKL